MENINYSDTHHPKADRPITPPPRHAPLATSIHSSDHEFTTLLRIVEDFAHRRHPYRKPFAPFVPRFDLEEHPDTYELYGDFPGVKPNDITVSVLGDSRIEVRGVIRHRLHGKEVETPGGSNVLITGLKQKVIDAAQAVVGDAQKPATTEEHHEPQPAPGVVLDSKVKQIIAERQEGEFHRVFHFPQPVELSDGVVARMDNGVLHVTIPRGPKPPAKQVDVAWVPYYGL